MTPEALTSVRELDGRFSDGLQVRLLWNTDSGRLWVSVIDTRTRDAFSIEVPEGQRPLEVFNHPYAYARTASVAPHAAGAGRVLAG